MSEFMPCSDESPSMWLDWKNAALYQSYVEEYPIYGWLNRLLVGVSGVDRAERILDLACGTGATASACTPIMGKSSELTGVDFSAPVVEIARAEIDDPRCRFRVIDARRLSRHLPADSFDAVVCNAAFWQLPDCEQVLVEVATVLRPGGSLSLNIPSQQLEPQQIMAHPFQVALSRHLYGLEDTGSPAFLQTDALMGSAARAGLWLAERYEATYFGTQRELVDLMRIPAMAASAAPGLCPQRCSRAVDAAARHVEMGQEVEVPWTFFRFQRESDSVPNRVEPRENIS